MARKKQEIALQREIENQEEWEDLMNKEGFFVVDVYQDWCGPCKSIVSIFRRIKNESGDDLLQFAVAKSNTIDSLERYRGKCQPCFLFYGSGTLVAVVRGANPPELEKVLKKHLENEHKVLKGEAERIEIKDPAFKDQDEAEKKALAKKEEEEDEVEKEVTVVLIKPDAVSQGKVDEIIQKLEEQGIEILEHQERALTEEEARDFYRHLEDQEWFDKMISYMIGGPSHVLVVSKGNSGIISEFRELLGPADATIAKEDHPLSLRGLFGSESFQNGIHAADSGEKAASELALFFPEFVIPKYKVTKVKKEDEHAKKDEYTVALLRHDAYIEFKDDILMKIQEAGFVIAMKKEVQLTREQVEEFYSEHKNEPYFEELILRMTNGPILALALAKQNAIENWRNLIGEKDPKVAKEKQPESLRAMFSKDDITINLIHGSDSREAALKELDIFFPMEHTLAVIKPDAYENKDEIIEKIKEKEFIISCKKEMKLTKEMAEELYRSHSEKEYFNDLIEHLTSGLSVILILTRQDAVQGWRNLIGETDPNVATENNPESIRALYGKDVKQNAVHGSSSTEHADKAMHLIFGQVDFAPDGKVVGYISEEDENTVLMTSDDEKIKMEAEVAEDKDKHEDGEEEHKEEDPDSQGDEKAAEGGSGDEAPKEEDESGEADATPAASPAKSAKSPEPQEPPTDAPTDGPDTVEGEPSSGAEPPKESTPPESPAKESTPQQSPAKESTPQQSPAKESTPPPTEEPPKEAPAETPQDKPATPPPSPPKDTTETPQESPTHKPETPPPSPPKESTDSPQEPPKDTTETPQDKPATPPPSSSTETPQEPPKDKPATPPLSPPKDTTDPPGVADAPAEQAEATKPV